MAKASVNLRKVLKVAAGTVAVSFISLISSGYSPYGNPLLKNSRAWAQAESPHMLIAETAEETSVSAGLQFSEEQTLPTQLADLDRYPLFLPVELGSLVAANSQLSPTALSHPSLLWIQDQLGSRYGSNRLIEQWQAYQTFDGLNYVDVVVNQPIWNLLNYFERYAFILQFGNAARDYGYNLRVFHSGDVINVRNVRGRDNRISRNTAARTITLRGAYLCSFPEGNGLPPTTAAEYACSIVLDESSSRPGLRNPL